MAKSLTWEIALPLLFLTQSEFDNYIMRNQNIKFSELERLSLKKLREEYVDDPVTERKKRKRKDEKDAGPDGGNGKHVNFTMSLLDALSRTASSSCTSYLEFDDLQRSMIDSTPEVGKTEVGTRGRDKSGGCSSDTVVANVIKPKIHDDDASPPDALVANGVKADNSKDTSPGAIITNKLKPRFPEESNLGHQALRADKTAKISSRTKAPAIAAESITETPKPDGPSEVKEPPSPIPSSKSDNSSEESDCDADTVITISELIHRKDVIENVTADFISTTRSVVKYQDRKPRIEIEYRIKNVYCRIYIFRADVTMIEKKLKIWVDDLPDTIIFEQTAKSQNASKDQSNTDAFEVVAASQCLPGFEAKGAKFIFMIKDFWGIEEFIEKLREMKRNLGESGFTLRDLQREVGIPEPFLIPPEAQKFSIPLYWEKDSDYGYGSDDEFDEEGDHSDALTFNTDDTDNSDHEHIEGCEYVGDLQHVRRHLRDNGHMIFRKEQTRSTNFEPEYLRALNRGDRERYYQRHPERRPP